MSLIDKIKARPENAGKGPKPAPAQPSMEIHKDEVAELNKELDSEVKSELESEEIKEENLTPEQIVKRTEDSYEDEIKKLREENAKRRKKEQEAKEKALAMADEVFKTEREEYERNLAEMKKQLEELKALKKEENKVDDQVAKAQTSAEIEILRQEMLELKKERDAARKSEQERAQKEAEEKALRKQAAENRFKSMLTEIPEEFKDYASAMFKGYSDPSEGLIAITKAKAQGIFGKRTIEVVSRIPRETNNNETKVLNSREKMQRKVSALKSRRTGLMPGQKL
jgi:DNA repair exonuclease SbcCD ATPase subunit